MQTARIYIFGDSLVYGAWDSQGGWCDRLKSRLHQLKLNQPKDFKFQVFNLGIGGETSRLLLKRLRFEIEARHRPDWPAVIVLAVGANDTRYTKNNDPIVPIDEYRANLELILKIAKQYTNKILLVGIAPVEDENQEFKGTLLSNGLLQKYDQVITKLAIKNKLPKVEIIDQFKPSNESFYSADGVHPNDAGHKVIEKAVWTELEKLLLK